MLYPHQEENIEVARKTLLSLKFKSIPGKAIRSEKMLKNILERIQEYEQQGDFASYHINQLPVSKRKGLSTNWMMEFANAQMADYMFKRTIPSNDLDVLLDVLKNAYGIEIEKKGRKLIFQNR